MNYLSRAGAPTPAEPPYSAVASVRNQWEYHLSKHHHHVDRAHHCVEDQKPKCHDPRLQRVQEHSRRFHVNERQAEIGRENRKLVDRLGEISNRGAPIHCAGGGSRSSSQPPQLLHEPLRRRVSRGIQQDNEQLVKRILSVKTSMNLRGMQQDFKRHQKYSMNLRRMPEDPRSRRKPRSLPPLQERLRPMSDPLRPPEGLLCPGDLCRIPRVQSGPASLDGSPVMPPRFGAGGSQSLQALKDPKAESQASTGAPASTGVLPLASTEPLSASLGSPPRSREGELRKPQSASTVGRKVASPGGSPNSTMGSSFSGRPPRPDAEQRPTTPEERREAAAAAAGPSVPPLVRGESDKTHDKNTWQQKDAESERRSWFAEDAVASGSPKNAAGFHETRDSSKDKLASSYNSDFQYEQDDWDDDSFDSASPSRSQQDTSALSATANGDMMRRSSRSSLGAD